VKRILAGLFLGAAAAQAVDVGTNVFRIHQFPGNTFPAPTDIWLMERADGSAYNAVTNRDLENMVRTVVVNPLLAPYVQTNEPRDLVFGSTNNDFTSKTSRSASFQGAFTGSAGGLTNLINGIVYARQFGAIPDGVVLDDVSTTNGSASFYSPTANFTAGDVGKSVMVYTNLSAAFAYTSTAGNNITNSSASYLVSSIASVEGPHNATLAHTSQGTVNPTRLFYFTDNTAAFQSAINASLGGIVEVERGVYGFSGPLQNILQQNSVLTIPAFNTNQTSITLRGVGNSFGYYTGYNPTTSSTNGTVLFCVTKGTTNYPAFIGCNMGIVTNLLIGSVTSGPLGSPWSSVSLKLEGIQFMTPENAQIGIINAMYGGGLIARDCVFMCDFAGDVARRGLKIPTSTNAFGVLAPGSSNNGQDVFENCWFLDLYIGMRPGDHTAIRDSFLAFCDAAIADPYLGGYLSMDNTALQANKYGITGLNGVTGLGSGIGGTAIINDVWLENNQYDLFNILCAKVSYLSSFKINIFPSYYANSIHQWWRNGGATPAAETMQDVNRDGYFTFQRNLSDSSYFNEIARFYSSEAIEPISGLNPSLSTVSVYGQSNAVRFGWSIVDWNWAPIGAFLYDRAIPGFELANYKSNCIPFRVSESAARDSLTVDSTETKTWNKSPAYYISPASAFYPSNYTVGCQITANADMLVTDLGVWCQSLTNGPTAVGIWTASNGVFLGSTVVTLGGGASVSNYNFGTLSLPVYLQAGKSYRIGECVTNNAWFFSSGGYYPTLDAHIDSSWYTTSNSLAFPDAIAGLEGNMYGPVSFKYRRIADVGVGGSLQVRGALLTSQLVMEPGGSADTNVTGVTLWNSNNLAIYARWTNGVDKAVVTFP